MTSSAAISLPIQPTLTSTSPPTLVFWSRVQGALCRSATAASFAPCSSLLYMVLPTSMQSFDAVPPPVTLESRHHILPIQPSLQHPLLHLMLLSHHWRTLTPNDPGTEGPWPSLKQNINPSRFWPAIWDGIPGVRNVALTLFPVIWFTLVGILVWFFYMSGNVLIAWW